tara:strand:+ start:9726 stop:10052 length:327 start_codon:yes stop_codon:yes gene_type:complete
MTPQHIDELLENLSVTSLPVAPPPHQVLRAVRKLRDSEATPEPCFAWLSFSQLSAALACVALVFGLVWGGISAFSQNKDSTDPLRDSLRLAVFDAEASGMPYQIILGR